MALSSASDPNMLIEAGRLLHEARIKQGLATLTTSALKGKGAMGAQGGGDFNDTEIARAVAYMANNAGAKFEEPKAPAAEEKK